MKKGNVMRYLLKIAIAGLFLGAPLISQAVESVIRVVAAPNNVYNSTQAANTAYAMAYGGAIYNSNGTYLGSGVTPKNQWYLVARYQGQNAVKNLVAYDPSAMTGLSTPMEYQRGMLGGTTPQTTYQLQGYNVGMLNLSWDFDGNNGETHPANIYCPQNLSNCFGVHKHVVYGYDFSPPVKTFTNPNDANSSLSIQADGMRVASFTPYDKVNLGGYPSSPVGQYYWVLFFRDSSKPSVPAIQLVIAIYQNAWHDGSEQIGVEYVGNWAQPYFVSSMQRGTKKFVDVRSDSALGFRTAPWVNMLFSRAHITPKYLKTIVDVANAMASRQCSPTDTACHQQAFNTGEGWCNRTPATGQYSCDLSNYQLASVHLIQEIQYERGDQVVMGSAAYAPAVYELRQY